MKNSLNTSITGRHGLYLEEFLLSKNYEFHEIKMITLLFHKFSIQKLDNEFFK